MWICILRFSSFHFIAVQFGSVQFSPVQLWTLMLSEWTVQSSWIQSKPTISPPWEWEIIEFHWSDTLFEKKSVSDWSFSLDFKNFDHFHLGSVRSGSNLSKPSVSYMNYYRYFDHIPWISSKWTHFLWKKVCDFIIFHGSRVRDHPKTLDFDHLDTLFVKKSVSFWLFRSISQANSRLKSESLVLYIKQRWFWRIFSSEYQVLYMNYVGFWGADFTQPGILVDEG